MRMTLRRFSSPKKLSGFIVLLFPYAQSMSKEKTPRMARRRGIFPSDSSALICFSVIRACRAVGCGQLKAGVSWAKILIQESDYVTGNKRTQASSLVHHRRVGVFP